MDSMGQVAMPEDKLWGAQTQRSLEYFSIGADLTPRQMIAAYAVLKKACARANFALGQVDDLRCNLIVQACDEILAGWHYDQFPLDVWMTGSGAPPQFDEAAASEIATLTGLPFVTAPNKFATQGAYDDMVALSGTLRTLAVSGRSRISGRLARTWTGR